MSLPECPRASFLSPRSRSNSTPSSTSAKSSIHETPGPDRDSPSPSHKTVHFPSDATILERIRTFKKHGRPIAVSHPKNEETETETEGESSSASGVRYQPFGGLSGSPSHATRTKHPSALAKGITSAFPSVTRFASSFISSFYTHTSSSAEPVPPFQIDIHRSSPIPCPSFDPTSHIHLESLHPISQNSECALHGTVLVQNLSFEKKVEVRFTLDDWVTISRVAGEYVETLPCFPRDSFGLGSPAYLTQAFDASLDEIVGAADQDLRVEWDRFEFTVQLDPFVLSLETRTLWLAVHCEMDGGNFWDNNRGDNYKIGLRANERGPGAGAVGARGEEGLDSDASSHPTPTSISSRSTPSTTSFLHRLATHRASLASQAACFPPSKYRNAA